MVIGESMYIQIKIIKNISSNNARYFFTKEYSNSNWLLNDVMLLNKRYDMLTLEKLYTTYQ